MIVYTAIVGEDYRRKLERTSLPPEDVACFTGATPPLFTRPVLEAKRYKILPHLFLPEHEVTIWTDANIRLKVDPQVLVDRYLGHGDLALFRHPYRKTVWQEFEALRVDPRFADPYLQEQLRQQHLAYRDAGLPLGIALHECNFLIRRNTDPINRLMEAWWAEITRWQWRDQVSFPYVLWRHWHNVEIRRIDGNIRDHPDFEYTRHY